MYTQRYSSLSSILVRLLLAYSYSYVVLYAEYRDDLNVRIQLLLGFQILIADHRMFVRFYKIRGYAN